MDRCILEIFEFQGHEAVVFGKLVEVDDDELQVTKRLGQGDKFRLELVEECEGGARFIEGGDFREEAHIFMDFTNALSIIDPFCLEPGPQGEEFGAGVADRVIKDRGAHVLKAKGKEGADKLDCLVSSCIVAADCLSKIGFHAGVEFAGGCL